MDCRYNLTCEDIESIKKQNSPKILLISHEMSLTGAPRALVHMADVMKKKGIEPVMLCDQFGLIVKEIEENGFKVIIDPELRYNVILKGSLLNRYLQCFDIIIFNTIVCAPLILIMQDLVAKKILWLHEGSMSYEYYEKKYNLGDIYNRFDYIYAVGSYSMSFAKKYVDWNNLGILYYGIPDEGMQNGQNVGNNRPINFLLAGTVEKRKGQDILIKAVEYLTGDIRDQIKIYVVGKGVDSKILQCVEFSPFECVKYIDAMEHEKLMEFYSKMDYILCPSLDDPMPIVCTEAMMFSKVVLVSEATGTASLIMNGENGYRYPAGSAKALANAIECAVSDYDVRYREMAMRSRSLYDEYFTMEKFEEEVYSHIVKVPKREITREKKGIDYYYYYYIVKNKIKSRNASGAEKYSVLKGYMNAEVPKSYKLKMMLKYFWYACLLNR